LWALKVLTCAAAGAQSLQQVIYFICWWAENCPLCVLYSAGLGGGQVVVVFS
jgi:hypothetical protein